MHYNRWIKFGDPGPPGPLPQRNGSGLAADPWSRVDRRGPNECWPWLGRANEKGYGRYGRTAAHRLIYELTIGPIPDDLQIDHLCRNRGCVNPAHMEPVTLRENLSRSTNFAAIGILFNTCIRGHEFTPENTYIRPSRPKSRICRTCNREQGRLRYLRTKEAPPARASRTRG